MVLVQVQVLGLVLLVVLALSIVILNFLKNQTKSTSTRQVGNEKFSTNRIEIIPHSQSCS